MNRKEINESGLSKLDKYFNKRYEDEGWGCPVCGSDELDEEDKGLYELGLFESAPVHWRKLICKKCKSTWVEHFTMQYIEDVKIYGEET